jgi:glycosyltransferase involved in cell wall biosynthesis
MLENTVLISVIITSFNYGHLIGETLESIFKQKTNYLYEVIVVNDGSTDDTINILSSYWPKVRIINNIKRMGQSRARNIAIREAKGNLIAFVDADDLWSENKLELQVKALNAKKENGLVYCNVESFNSENNISLGCIGDSIALPEGHIYEKLLISNCILSPSPLVKKQLLLEVGVFDENVKKCEDWDLWLRIAARSEIVVVNKVLARRRVHALAVSKTEDLDDFYSEAYKILFKNVCLYKNINLKTIRRSHSNIAFSTGTKMVERRQYKKALYYYGISIYQWPWNIGSYAGLGWIIISGLHGNFIKHKPRLNRAYSIITKYRGNS